MANDDDVRAVPDHSRGALPRTGPARGFPLRMRGGPSRRARTLFSCAALALSASLLGCASAPLVPLTPARDGVTTVSRGGIELSAEVQPGNHNVPSEVTSI